MIRLMVGLGNPGAEYDGTRHNAGFWFIDEVARQVKAPLAPDRAYFGMAARASRPNGPLWLLEPMTFMNLSGKSVSALARFFKIAPDEILVAHDDLDLAPGHMKMKFGGSHAGHNGLRDIQAQLGTGDFWRLRLGIGHPGIKSEVSGYVLRRPPVSERMAIDECITQASGSLDVLIDGPMERAMMKIHARPAQPKSAAPVRPPTLSAVASAMAKGPELPAGAPSSPAAAGHLPKPPAGDRPD